MTSKHKACAALCAGEKAGEGTTGEVSVVWGAPAEESLLLKQKGVTWKVFSDLISSVACVFCLLCYPGHLVCFKRMHPAVRKEWLPPLGGAGLRCNLLKHHY